MVVMYFIVAKHVQFVPEKIEPVGKSLKARSDVSIALDQGDDPNGRMSIPWASPGKICCHV